MNVKNFNSHAHVERDGFRHFVRHKSHISTHTLTWSVTRGLEDMSAQNIHFNSHAHVERDYVRIEEL